MTSTYYRLQVCGDVGRMWWSTRHELEISAVHQMEDDFATCCDKVGAVDLAGFTYEHAPDVDYETYDMLLSR